MCNLKWEWHSENYKVLEWDLKLFWEGSDDFYQKVF